MVPRSSDTSSDDDKPIGELIAAQYTSKEDMMKSKPNPSPQETKQEEENLSHGEAVQYLESPVSEPKGEKAKTVFPRHQEQAVQQTKESGSSSKRGITWIDCERHLYVNEHGKLHSCRRFLLLCTGESAIICSL